MSEEYLRYWGMTKPPFSLTPDPDMLYLSSQHAECLMRLKYAVFSHKGGALLVSDNAGNGKTSILTRLIRDLGEYYGGRVKVAFIDHPTLSPIEMISEIGRQLGVEMETTEKIKALNALRDRLFHYYNDNTKVIVIVDEGQMLQERPDILGELRILLNFCVSDAFLLTFIFSGQKQLELILRETPEFWQRLPVRYFLKNLSFNDTRELIRFRLARVGVTGEVFRDEAFDGIFNYSKGCPRVICSLADLCLIIGFAKGVKRIGFVEVTTACRDMESSGDGFHYYAYLNARHDGTLPATSKQEGRSTPTLSSSTPEHHGRKPHRTVVPDPADDIILYEPSLVPREEPLFTPHHGASSPVPIPTTAGLTAAFCTTCAGTLPDEVLFCPDCGRALRQRCAACLTLVETDAIVCPSCGVTLDDARSQSISEISTAFAPFDILPGGKDIWIAVRRLELENGERPVMVFPRGNIITPGPTAQRLSPGNRGPVLSCDLVITDRRLILAMGEDIVITDLARIESCTIADTGGILGKRPVLLVQTRAGSWALSLPAPRGKIHILLSLVQRYIHSVQIATASTR